MGTDASASERKLLDQAAQWFAVLRDESVTDADRARWREWLAARPEHAHAWQRVEAIGRPFEHIGRSRQIEPARQVLERLERARAASQSRRRALKLLGAGGVLFGAALLARQLAPWRDWAHDYAVARADYRTRVGEIRRLDLPDGSRLFINTASAVDLDYRRDLRRIVLREGEILVASAPDPRQSARPLVVDTAHGRLTALGTRFSVRSGREMAALSVFEGAVRVAPADGGPALDAPAGSQARVTRRRATLAGRADPAREGWSRGLLIADNQRLDDFLAELARHTPVPLAVAPDVAALRLVGVYRIADPALDVPRILVALEAALPVRASPTAAGGMRIEAR